MTDRRGLADAPELAGKLQLEKIERATNAGVDWIQIREKDLSGWALAEFAERAIALAGRSAAVLVNDRMDVACAVDASGVHLGEHSLPAGEAKRFVRERCARGNFLVGVSAHSLEGALQAEKAGADYVIYGPVYATPSKAGFGKPQGVERLHDVCHRVAIPVLAIGGITRENTKDCLAAGAAGIAAIRLFQEAVNVDELVRGLRGVS